jgi:DNA-directed RNA polymerase subunit beta
MVKNSIRRDGSFYIPDFIEIQKKSFFHFLEVGILNEFQKMGPILAGAGEIQIIFYPNHFILTPPAYTIREAILEGKTYESKLYVPAKMVSKGSSEREAEWVLVGSIPLMTRRGHFIINGSPRVIVNQMVRSPGIYFHRRVVGKKRKQIYSVDVIPFVGSWLRLEEKQGKQLYAHLKRTPKIPYQLLFTSMDAFEKETDSEKDTSCLLWRYRERLALHLLDRFVNDTLDEKGLETAKRKLAQFRKTEKLTDPIPFFKYTFFKYAQVKEVATQMMNDWNKPLPIVEMNDLSNTLLRFTKSDSLLTRSARKRETPSVNQSAPLSQSDPTSQGWVDAVSLTQIEKARRREMILSEIASPLGLVGVRPVSPLAPFSRDASPKGPSESPSSRFSLAQREATPKVSRALAQRESDTKGESLLFTKGDKRERSGRSKSERREKRGAREWNGEKAVRLNQLMGGTDLAELFSFFFSEAGSEEWRDTLTEIASFFFLRALPCGWQQGRTFLYEKFKNPATYTLGRLGRARIDRKLEDRESGSLLSYPSMQLMARDLKLASNYLRRVKKSKLLVDDIDHLKNRRVKTCGELLQNQFHTGLDRLKTLVRFKVSRGEQSISLKSVIDAKAVDAAWREFFGSNPLSQYMDQTNPLAEITHKRRVSCLGPGGVSRETAAMAMRGIHPSHYGRICPIETPEGKNAGLVNSLSVYTRVGRDGVLETPYYRVKEGQIQRRGGFNFFSAQKEEDEKASIAPPDVVPSRSNLLPDAPLPVRRGENLLDNYGQTSRDKIQYVGISRIQMISIATSLIPFLEHNDGNRALMGSNMQRQAVPLLTVEQPIVGTGLEGRVVAESGHILEAWSGGRIFYVSGKKIIVQRFDGHRLDGRRWPSNRRLSRRFDRLAGGNSLLASSLGSLAPLSLALSESGRNEREGFTTGFSSLELSWVKRATPTPSVKKGLSRFARSESPKVSRFTSGDSLRERSGLLTRSLRERVREKFTPRFDPFALKNALQRGQIKYSSLRSGRTRSDHLLGDSLRERSESPKVKRSRSERERPLDYDLYPLQTFQPSNQKTCLRHRPWVKEGDWVQPGDLLADCAASRGGQLSLGRNVVIAYLPWDGYNFEDAVVVSDRLLFDDLYTSLHIEKYDTEIEEMEREEVTITRKNSHLHPIERASLDKHGVVQVGKWVETGDLLISKVKLIPPSPISGYERLAHEILGKKPPKTRDVSLRLAKWVEGRVIYVKKRFQKKQKKEEPEKLIYVRLHLVEKKKIQVGDKVAGRHGNKGIISTILPRQDMPYLPDGTTVDMVLNPLGVPSRMNVGQVFEALLGLAGGFLKQRFTITPFDEMYGSEASRSLVYLKLYQARLRTGHEWLFWPDFPGKMRIFDGRSGESFHQPVTVGRAYMLKLIHLVDEKIHARSRGPYNIITQQPVRGRAKGGGQRLGEMEVWAVEGYGAAYTLQEILTTKSDDIQGRREVWRRIIGEESRFTEDTTRSRFIEGDSLFSLLAKRKKRETFFSRARFATPKVSRFAKSGLLATRVRSETFPKGRRNVVVSFPKGVALTKRAKREGTPTSLVQLRPGEFPLGRSGGFKILLRELQSLCLDIGVFGKK